MTSATIPQSVTSIGDIAFKGCSGLTSITISNSVTSIGKAAFQNCIGLTSIIIPQSVISIGYHAFEGCSSLASATIEEGVKIINENAFYDCSNLNKLIIPNSVYLIGSNAFHGTAWYNNQSDGVVYAGKNVYTYKGTMSQNTEIVLREGTISIGECAFSRFSGLRSITIPQSLTHIYFDAFYGCNNLQSVYISDIAAWCNITFGVVDTDEYNTVYTSYYSNPLLSAQHLYLNGKEIKNLIIPIGVTSISDYAFMGFCGLTSVTIPNSVTKIGHYAFKGCRNIVSMDIPASVTSIGTDAFVGTQWYDNYEGLMYLGSIAYKYNGNMPENTEIVIRDGTTEISNNAFKDCKGLVSVTIPASVTSIGYSAFSGCSGLTSVHISDIAAWCNINWSSSPFSNTFHLFQNGKEIQNLIIPDGISYIKNGAFNGCYGLISVTIPSSVKEIGYSAFSKCSGLTSINIPESVTKIGYDVFSGCSSLTSVTIPNSVSSIDGVFRDCTGLTTVTLPNNIKAIGSSAFYGCIALKSIIIPNSVTSIESSAFNGCSSLTSMTIPNNVTTIGSYAFSGCTSLNSLIIPYNVSEIGTYVFSDCDNLKYIVFGSDKFTNYKQLGSISAQIIMPQSVYDKGIPSTITNFATYSSVPMYVDVKSKGATSAVLELYPADRLTDNSDLIESFTCTILGLTPGQNKKYLTWKKDDENYGIVSFKAENTLTLTVQEPKALSTKKARLLATAEEADDFEHYGFEWRQYNAPEGRPSNKVSAPLYNGCIIGTLNNLNPNVDYNYRPFYKADDGTIFYGEWMWLYTGDTNIFFEPEVYTKDASEITKVSALLAGFWIEGTDDIEENGFEYWTVSNNKTRTTGSDTKKVIVTGNVMTATLDGLKSGTEYGYRSYVKTTSGKMTYGEEKTFRTILIGDVNGDCEVNEDDAKDIASHIIGQTPTGFIKEMADANGDSIVNAADIVTVINIIMNNK